MSDLPKNPWDNDVAAVQTPVPNTAPTGAMPWDQDLAHTQNPPSSADQVQSLGTSFGQKVLDYGQDAGVGVLKTAASVADLGIAPLGGGDIPIARSFADAYLPAYKNKIMGAGAEGATMGGALAGAPGAVVGGLSGAGTEWLNEVRPDSPVANVLEPAALSMLAAPGAVGNILKAGRIGLEGLGVLKRPDLIQAKMDQGITAGTPASTTDSDFWYKMQRSLREVLFGKSINQAEKSERWQLAGAVNRQADELGPNMTKQEFGASAKQDLGDGINLTKQLFSTQHTILDRMIDPTVPRIDMYPIVRRLIDDLSAAKGAQTFTEGLGVQPLSHVENMMTDIVKFGAGDKLPIAAVRNMRHVVGDKLEESILNGDPSKRALKIMYGALADAEDSAYAGTNAYSDYKQLKAAEAEFYPAVENFVEPLLKQGLKPEEIAGKLAKGMKLGGTGLEKALPILEQQAPALKDAYSGMILRDLGRNLQGNFDANRFYKNWINISPEAKQMLFGQGANRDIPKAYDQLALIAENQARGAAAVNPSRTAGTWEIFSLFSKFGAVLGGIGGYEYATNRANGNQDNEAARFLEGAGIGSLAMSTIGAAAIGRMMTNPAFIRWLATPTPLSGAPAHIKLLGAIGGEYPAIKDDVNKFSDYLSGRFNTHEKPHQAVDTFDDDLQPFAAGGSVRKIEESPHIKGFYYPNENKDKVIEKQPRLTDDDIISKYSPWKDTTKEFAAGGPIEANENEPPGSLIDMVLHGHNVIPMKSGSKGATSGVQYDMLNKFDPSDNYAAGFIMRKNSDPTLWTTRSPGSYMQGQNTNNNQNLKSLEELQKQIPKDKLLFGSGSPESGAVLKPGSGVQWDNNMEPELFKQWLEPPPVNDKAQGGLINHEDTLSLIDRFESNHKNVMNYIGDKTHTAQGYFQITNSTWKDFARDAGIDLSKFPNAMSAPYEVQKHMASTILESPRGGIGRWANYNPKLAAAIGGKSIGNLNGDKYEKEGLNQPQQAEAQEQPEITKAPENQSLIDSIMNADWIEPTTKIASRTILKGES